MFRIIYPWRQYTIVTNHANIIAVEVEMMISKISIYYNGIRIMDKSKNLATIYFPGK